MQGKGLTPLKPFLDEIGIVVSNPPYIKSEYIRLLDSKVRDHEPLLALDGGPDGVSFFEDLFDDLVDGKLCYFEIACYNKPFLEELGARKLPGYAIEFKNDIRENIRYAILRPKG